MYILSHILLYWKRLRVRQRSRRLLWVETTEGKLRDKWHNKIQKFPICKTSITLTHHWQAGRIACSRGWGWRERRRPGMTESHGASPIAAYGKRNKKSLQVCQGFHTACCWAHNGHQCFRKINFSQATFQSSGNKTKRPMSVLPFSRFRVKSQQINIQSLWLITTQDSRFWSKMMPIITNKHSNSVCVHPDWDPDGTKWLQISQENMCMSTFENIKCGICNFVLKRICTVGVWCIWAFRNTDRVSQSLVDKTSV